MSSNYRPGKEREGKREGGKEEGGQKKSKKKNKRHIQMHCYTSPLIPSSLHSLTVLNKTMLSMLASRDAATSGTLVIPNMISSMVSAAPM